HSFPTRRSSDLHASIGVPSTVKWSSDRNRFGHCPCQQTISIFVKTVGCHTGHRLVRRKPHEPPEQQVVFQLFHQHPLAAHRVKHLQKQSPQQGSGGIDFLPSSL